MSPISNAIPQALHLTSYHYAATMHWLGSQLAAMSATVSKVAWAIAYKTFGFRKRDDEISVSQFMELTGLCRQAVISAIRVGCASGVFRRHPHHNSYKYALNIPHEVFNNVNNDPTPDDSTCGKQPKVSTSPESDSKNFSTVPVYGVDTQIKAYVTDEEEDLETFVDTLATLDDINAEAQTVSCYPLRNPRRWATRARRLGMNRFDLYELWNACKRAGRKPMALLIERLSHDGKPPTPSKTVTQDRARLDTYRRFREGLE